MQFPDTLRIFTLPLVADEGGGYSPGEATGIYARKAARASVLSASDAHIEVGVGNARLWRIMLEPSPNMQYPAQTYYVSLYSQSSCPLLLADRCYEVIKARHQRRGSGPIHHTSLIVKEAAITDPTVIVYPTPVDIAARWALEFEFAGDLVITLPRDVQEQDYVTLVIEHGDQRTIEYIIGRDFTRDSGGGLDLTDLSEVLEDGDILWIVNHGAFGGLGD